jgi:hypothetical protein
MARERDEAEIAAWKGQDLRDLADLLIAHGDDPAALA